MSARSSPVHRDLLGRDAELARLEGVLEAARRGRGRLVMISGEPGIGRTSLAEATAASASAAGFHVAWARGWAGGSAPPQWLWHQVLRALPGTSTSPRGLDGAAVDRAGERLVDELCAATEQGPVLVVLDDLHEAGADAVRVLPFVAAAVRDHPVVLLGTVRSGAARSFDGIREVLTHLVRWHLHLPLTGLDEPTVARLLGRLGVDRPEALAARVHAACAGNPMLVSVLARAGGRLTGSAVPITPPSELRAHVRRELDRLPPLTRPILDAVAVLARTTTIATVAAMVGKEIDEVRAVLRPAVDEGLLEDRADGSLRLRHELVAECCYADLAPADRARLHGAAARALRSRGIASPVVRAQIAHHAFHAALPDGDPGAQLDDLLTAASDAQRAGASSEAAALLNHAAASAEAAGTPSATRGRILMDLAAAQNQAGLAGHAESSWQAASAVARLAGDAQLLARAAIGTSRSALLLGLTTSAHVRALEEAAEALDATSSPLRAQVLGYLASALHWTPERFRSRPLADEAIAMARDCGDAAALVVALLARHYVTRGPDGARERTRIVAEAITTADAAGDDDLSALARSALIVDHRELGDSAATRSAIGDLRAFARAAGHGMGAWAADAHDLVSLLLEGETEQAAVLVTRLSRLPTEHSALHPLIDFVRLMTDLGPPGDDLRARLRDVTAQGLLPAAWRARALLDAAGRDEPGTDGELRAMVQRLATARDDDSHWLLAAALTAEAAVLLRDARAATVLRHRLAPHAGAIVVAGRLGACRGSLRYHLGVLALTAGDHAEAIMHLEKAEEQHARPGFAAHLPRTVVALTRARRGARLAEWSAAGPWSLIRTGGYWALHGPSGTSALPDVKGMRYLARVLAAPHVEFGALDLFRMDAAGPGTTATAPGAGLTVDAGGADPILDATAKRAYRERLRALADELSAAQRLHDDERAADLHDEQTALEAVLSVGVGLSGRDRHLPSEAERARSSVTKALRAAIDRIRAVDSDLGAHLDASLRTGKRCCYAPDGPPLADSPG